MSEQYRPLPHISELVSAFDYDPTTGLLIRKNDGSSVTHKTFGYLRVRLNGRIWQAHRIVWKMMTGEDPVNQIDHIDGNRSNNAFCNLREVSNSENCRNRGRISTNSSGITGVSRQKDGGGWRINCTIDGREKHARRPCFGRAIKLLREWREVGNYHPLHGTRMAVHKAAT